MTFLQRIAPDNIRQSLSSLTGTASRHRRSLRLAATAVLAVGAVVAPIAVQAAYAAPAHQSTSQSSDFAAQVAFKSLADAKLTADQVKGRADLTQLNAAIENLENNYSSDPAVLAKLTDAANSAAVMAEAVAAGHDAGAPIAQAAVAKAKAEKAAAEAAARAKAAAAAKAAAEAAAASSSSSSSYDTPSVSVSVSPGSAQAIAKSMAAARGWGDDQFACLVNLWNRESGWSTTAGNPDGAYGIPQALPGSKMASAGSDWQTSASTQIAWGLGYIAGSYGTPCNAWAHSQSTGWY
ncbi:lytic transglycosylase domain-containing protein [Humibacter ginsenosidimutans]|uniref:aggregation-promoting factor C-terminal-like domain-containing protein n=1 Tax=Humibacter ginsenosidimutans TaxID=2599293 RepID=UPI001FF056D5|nr:lytic transglycosylase domain-containing protein [Humibacter ginsenosidimutans]